MSIDIRQQLEGLVGAARLTRKGIAPLGLDVDAVEAIAKAAIWHISRLEKVEASARRMMEWRKYAADPEDVGTLIHAYDELRAALRIAPAQPGED